MIPSLSVPPSGLTWNHRDSILQIRQLVFATARRDGIVAVYPNLSDPQNTQNVLIYHTLDDDYDRNQVREELRNAYPLFARIDHHHE